MAESILRAIIEGDAKGAMKAFRETAEASEATGKTVVKSGEEAAAGAEKQSAVGVGSIARMATALGPWGVAAGVAVVAVAAIGGAAVEMASKYDDATSRMAATADITKEQAKEIGDAFLTTGGKTVFSAQKMMEAYGPVSGQLEQVNHGVLTTAQSLDVMKASAALASATGTDLTSATATLAGTMQAFQIPISGAAAATDMLFNSSRTLNVPIADLSSELGKMHGKLGDLGGSLPQLNTMLVDLAEHGETGKTAVKALSQATDGLLAANDANHAAMDKAQTALDVQKEKLDALTSSHKASASAISKQKDAVEQAQGALDAAKEGIGGLGLTVLNSQGKFIGMGAVIAELRPKLEGMTEAGRRQAENAIFGAGAFDKLDATIMAGKEGYDKAAEAANKQGTAQEGANKATDNLAGSMDKMKGAFSNIMVTLGQHLLPIFDKLMSVVAGAVVWFADKLPGALDILGKAFSVIGTAIGIYVGVISAVIHGIVDAVTWVINSPVFQALVSFIGFEVQIVIGIVKGVIAVITGIVDAVQWVINSPVFQALVGFIKMEIGIIGAIIGGIVDVVKSIAGTIGDVFGGIGSAIRNVFQGATDFVVGIFRGLTRIISDVIDVPIGLINNVIGFINDKIQIHIPAIGVGPVHTPSFDWNGLNIPKIPTLDTGGIVQNDGLAFLHRAEVVVNPAQQAMAMGGGGTHTHNYYITSNDPQAVVNALRRYQQKNGSIPIKVAAA